MGELKAEILQRLRRPGILIRLDGSAEVFYIDEDALEAFKLPKCFQAGGQADPTLFKKPPGPEISDTAGELMTGDELQRELNKGSLFRRTNLLNAFFCEDGPFIQGNDNAIELTTGVGKGHKPLTRFPSF